MTKKLQLEKRDFGFIPWNKRLIAFSLFSILVGAGVTVAGPRVSAQSSNAPSVVKSSASTSATGAIDRGERLVRSALACRGMAYRRGASGNGAFDCSGFTCYLFSKEGASLPRTASEQYAKGEHIGRDHMHAGDLVFFAGTYKSGISHVGVYIGNNAFIHAAGYGRGVRVDSLNEPYYQNHWAGARRPK